MPKDFKSNKELFNIPWSRDTLIVNLNEQEIYYCGPNSESIKNLPLPKLRGLKDLLLKPYKEFSHSTNICYCPTESQIKAIEDIEYIIGSSLNKSFLEKINKHNDNRNTDNDIGVAYAKKLMQNISMGSDNVFLERFSETQMFNVYLKENQK